MDEAELERYLHESIPLASAMQVSVAQASLDRVALRAPLEPNINHHGTLFGGSASAIAILAAWSLVRLRLLAEDAPHRIVIFRNTMQYDRPIAGPFVARAQLDPAADWPRFMEILRHMGKAKIAVGATLEYQGVISARMSGQFAALADENNS